MKKTRKRSSPIAIVRFVRWIKWRYALLTCGPFHAVDLGRKV